MEVAQTEVTVKKGTTQQPKHLKRWDIVAKEGKTMSMVIQYFLHFKVRRLLNIRKSRCPDRFLHPLCKDVQLNVYRYLVSFF